MRRCSVRWCKGVQYSFGMCRKHRVLLKTTGSTAAPPPAGDVYVDESDTTHLVACRVCGDTWGPWVDKGQALAFRNVHAAKHY